ncbi:MAG: YbaK/EbsC family protein [Clostridia bacterium]|nr:YbaK/EbsC family protein [Clostridia bacterium]
MRQLVLDFLHNHAIPYTIYTHQPVVSVEDSKRIIHIEGCSGYKSLFVKDKKSDNYYMVVLPADKRADMRALAHYVGCEKFEFGTADKMLTMLGVVRGNVSPFCFICPQSQSVKLLLDYSIRTTSYVRFHPCDNTATLVLEREQFIKCMSLLNKTIIYVE